MAVISFLNSDKGSFLIAVALGLAVTYFSIPVYTPITSDSEAVVESLSNIIFAQAFYTSLGFIAHVFFRKFYLKRP